MNAEGKKKSGQKDECELCWEMLWGLFLSWEKGSVCFWWFGLD